MSTFQYEVFLEVVETGSFTKAGEKLGLTQSGVSHNILTLETELGVVLLHRNRNGISLSDAGERLIPYIRQIIQTAKRLEQEAAFIQGIEVGTIKIGSFPSFSSKFLPGIIKDFQKIYTGIKIELFEGDYGNIKKWLTQGTIDFGFLPLPIHDFESISLQKDRLFVFLHKHHHLSTLEKLNINSLQSESFIMPKSGCEILVKGLLKKHNIEPNIVFEIEDNQTIISMVEEEIGLTILPELVLPKHLSNTKVIPLEQEMYREIGLVIKSMKQASPSVKKCIEIVKEKCNSLN
ncbi:LysR family transcriptional regulator [Bacillus sp. OAE603]|uniref:LysR family transcriptional regulator n=1 Tax=Gottfriedia sp. OAE603 TaxID=2663872 RepID=UPI00178A248A